MSSKVKVANSQTVSKLFKSRKIILEQSKVKGFDISDYDNFSVNEIAVLNQNKQMDLLLENKKKDKKMYIKYHLSTKLRNNHIYDYIEDLFNIEEILEKTDDLVIVTKERINDNLLKFLDIIYKKDGYFINIYNYNDFLFNILNNELVPPHRILSNEEKNEVKEKYNLVHDSEFPEISRFDPVATILSIRPGEVFEIIRSSPTSIQSKYYRLCI